MKTKTSALWAQHQQQFSDNLRALEEMAHEEFPPGTKVEFPYGLKTLSGVVMDVGGYKSTTIRVRTKSGAEHHVDCQRLRPAAPSNIPVSHVPEREARRDVVL